MMELVFQGSSWPRSSGTQYVASSVKRSSHSSRRCWSSSQASRNRSRSAPRSIASLVTPVFSMAPMPRLLGRHVAQPGGELAADVELARAGRAAAGRSGVVGVGAVAARDVDPIARLRSEPLLHPFVDFEVVGQDPRAGAVHDVGERYGVAVHLLRSALQAER